MSQTELLGDIPEWLQKRRKDYTAAAEAAELPDPETEDDWRYSDIGLLQLDAYEKVSASRALGDEIPRAKDLLADLQEEVGELSGLLVSQCGYLADIWISKELKASGVLAGRLLELENEANGLRESLGSVMQTPPDIFAAMNEAYMEDPLVISVPSGVHLQHPIAVLDLADVAGASFFPRLIVNAEPGSQLQVVNISRFSDDQSLSVPVVELVAGSGSNVSYLSIVDSGQKGRQIAFNESYVGSQATLTLGSVTLGGESIRLRTNCNLAERGASGNIVSVYFASQSQHFDFRTFQHHTAPDTNSNLLFKGAVDEDARLIYSGLIRIDPDARGVDARQANLNLKLSENAWVESVPNLEIQNNDVSCSHASSVGPIDEDQLFYLESRGILPDKAEELILSGFFGEALGRLPVQEAAESLKGQLFEYFSKGEKALQNG